MILFTAVVNTDGWPKALAAGACIFSAHTSQTFCMRRIAATGAVLGR